MQAISAVEVTCSGFCKSPVFYF